MQRSSGRILTTHVGSLPRPVDLLQSPAAGHLTGQAPGPANDAARESRLRSAVAEIVRKQASLGIDIVDDGEFGKPSFVTYVNERLDGFDPGGLRGSPWAHSRETASFPEFYEVAARAALNPGERQTRMVCHRPIRYRGHQQLQRDISNLKAALQNVAVEEAFLPAISPTIIEDWQENEYYNSQEEYLFAIADAMHEEYKAIVDAGLLVQVDDPRLSTYYLLNPDKSIEQCQAWAELRVEALNQALRGIPEECIRFHTCYSINMGPRVHDMELKDGVSTLLKIHAGAYSFEAANPRHEHEWRVWSSIKLPEGKLLIPGCITQSTVLVEHPRLVADRIVKYASIAGRENIIAGADCGFATFAGSLEIHPSIVWAKFQSLAEGARIATRELWP